MKKVKVLYELLVFDDQIKDEEEILNDGYDDLDDAVASDGLDAIIDGSYEYTVSVSIFDAH